MFFIYIRVDQNHCKKNGVSEMFFFYTILWRKVLCGDNFSIDNSWRDKLNFSRPNFQVLFYQHCKILNTWSVARAVSPFIGSLIFFKIQNLINPLSRQLKVLVLYTVYKRSKLLLLGHGVNELQWAPVSPEKQ